MELDETDRAILRILQSDARTPFSEIARQIEMSSATVHDRVGRMEEAGIIEGYHAKIDPRAVGLGTSALVGLRIEQGNETDAVERLREIEGVQEIHLTTGEWDVVLRLYAEDTDGLRELMFEQISRIEGFSRSQTMVILATDLEERALPI
ncbi:Lrp/AsnC family transcriptional regulator [Halobellus limi]|jgi:Lrp/AsnC family transcriptional regulator for asnA, asnC and gidA|uniref:Lrp/AsnC family transcriptional regulator n=1 Tax=Halobellus limi TaxID=699433 RepID=A0A1H5U991_9EURY|nr:Lrp/AsnC family transcriptional regulator [Halobellus limi]QCC47104.1 Lrp/AsnC family transcriptional regulator [Halobellus limi]SEF71616.1 Lrp/AsnC family transcriptional regulator, regulator for asnA, asnC and gidA [Halobellus limi]